jgi:hypothetical protein
VTNAQQRFLQLSLKMTSKVEVRMAIEPSKSARAQNQANSHMDRKTTSIALRSTGMLKPAL